MPRYPQGGDWKDDRVLEIHKNHSVICKINNQTKYTFHWEDFRLQDYSNFLGNGPYYDHKREIGPGDSAIVRMISQKADRGVEVWVTYNTDAGPIEFHFNNPYVGGNSYHTYKLPSVFESIHNSGKAEAPWDWKNPNVQREFGNQIDGDHPKFEWTIRQRE